MIYPSSRKRLGVQDNAEIFEDETSGKRARSTHVLSKGVKHELRADETKVPPGGPGIERDNGPVQQLVSMFRTLVAQGEKAVASLEILISSISADLLAEVVIANMQNLPLICPPTEGDEEPISDRESHGGLTGSNPEFANLASLLANILSQSSTSSLDDTQIDSLPSAPNELEPLGSLEDGVVPGLTNASKEAPLITSIPVSLDEPVNMEKDTSGTPPEGIDIDNLESEIPVLDIPVPHDDMITTSLGSAELQDANQNQVSSLARASVEIFPSVSTDRSEELSPRTRVTDTCSINSSTATSAGFSKQLLLPKISVPVLTLTNDQSDNLQKLAFVRITDAYKQIAVAGGSQACLSVLAFLGVKFPLDLDSWKLLQTHILSDYENHEIMNIWA